MMAPVRRRIALVALALVALAFLAYHGATRCGFVNFDDNLYVTENANVKAGLTSAGVAWAWTTFHTGNWHPLTWMALQLDASLYGVQPAGFHLTNVALHALNTALLFLLLWRLTGAAGRSALVAALFAVHPLHVESVAWVTERKDVLSTLFALLALLAYRRYAALPSWRAYALVALCQVLSLLAKPMLVTLPVLLLLLDWWPLRRWPAPAQGQGAAYGAVRLLLEKVPLVVISLAFSVVTLAAQSSEHSVAPLESVAVPQRIGNSLVAVVTYLRQTFWPVGLAVHYPYAFASAYQALGSGLLLVGTTGLLACLRRPAVLVGWLWFLVSLLPVIGLVQVGEQARADRYTYLPHVGLFTAVVWGAAELSDRWGLPHRVRPALAAAAVLGLAVLTDRQVAVWRDSLTLWQHAREVLEPEPGWKVLYNLGLTLLHKALDDQARPVSPGAQRDRLRRTVLERLQEARSCLTRALAASSGPKTSVRTRTALGIAHQQLGVLLLVAGRPDEAVSELRSACECDPEPPPEYAAFLAYALAETGRNEESRGLMLEARRQDLTWIDNLARRAWTLATDRDPRRRDGARALVLAGTVCAAAGEPSARDLDVLAAAQAEAGQFDRAVATARRALDAPAPPPGLRHRLHLYESGTPYRE